VPVVVIEAPAALAGAQAKGRQCRPKLLNPLGIPMVDGTGIEPVTPAV
jgi:hypothetical protein